MDMIERVRRANLSRMARFGLVGLSGVAVNSAVLWLLVRVAGLAVLPASALATEVAIVCNFLLNDRWTFQGAGRQRSALRRLLRYNGVALGGLLITVATLGLLTSYGRLPLLAANLAAVGAALLWNYSLNSRWTWNSAVPALPVARPAAPLLERAAGSPYATRQLEAPLRERAVGSPYETMQLEAPAAGPAARPDWRERTPALIAGALVALSLAWVMAAQPGAWALLAGLLLGLALVARPGLAARQAALLVLAAGVGISSFDYMTWRAGMINWGSWWVGLPLYLAELFGALHTLGLQYTVWPRPEPALRRDEDPTRRPIFILIPTVDEGRAVLEPTLRGALAARDAYLAAHPRGRVTVVVCNDGRVAGAAGWQDAERLAAELGVHCVTRSAPGGAKAGNLEHARRLVGATGGALVAIFDADQIAEPDFLLRMVPPLADSRLGWVQSGQYYRNLENPVARWANDQQALFYRVLCPGKSAQNAAFICGTNVVLRAAALDEIGGLPQDSVTEDFAASIELHPRWRSIFIGDVLARGLGPMDLRSYFGQQRRWAIGTLGVLRSHWRQILLPAQGGLSLAQRIQYALACTHYLSGLRDLIYIVAPLIFLLLGVSAMRGAFIADFLWHFLPYWLISQLAFWHVARPWSSWRGIAIGFGSFPVLIGSLLTVLAGRRVGFTVTGKRRADAGGWAQVRPHLVAMAACGLALGLALWSRLSPAPLLISILWVLYSMLLLGSVAGLALLDRGAGRRAPAARISRRGRPRLGRGGLATLGVGGALVVMLAGFSLAPRRPAAFVPAQEPGAAYLGLSLPHDLLGEQPAALEEQLGWPFGIIGRTQDIDDRFDRPWADGLAAEGARPWVTLLFGVPGQELYTSSLPAIANGVHDGALRAWARGMRDYERPVYLTILPHVDRNWSISSAVANGGIPQDVPRAWAHVRAIFREEGALNVAFVWAPAVPGEDQEYAPAADQIDAVLVSLISFPQERWAEPDEALAAVRARHPRAPLLLEVSAAGPADRKAAWLRAVGAAAAEAGVYALLYHEGAPDPQAGPAEQRRWSVAAEPAVLAAMRDAAAAYERRAGGE